MLAACDAQDGVDATECWKIHGNAVRSGNVAVQRRTRSQTRASSAAQVEAARRVYRGPVDPTTGAKIYPGLSLGSEPFWPNRDPSSPFPIPISYYKWLVFSDPNWDWKTFD